MKQSCGKFVPILYSMIIWSRIDHEQQKITLYRIKKFQRSRFFNLSNEIFEIEFSFVCFPREIINLQSDTS